MNGGQYPWRQPRELEALLAEVKAVLVSLGVVEPGAGCSEAEIAAAEGRSRPFPEDVRAFYRAMRPNELFAPGQRKEFGFYTIGSKELTWKSMDGAEPAVAAHAWPGEETATVETNRVATHSELEDSLWGRESRDFDWGD